MNKQASEQVHARCTGINHPREAGRRHSIRTDLRRCIDVCTVALRSVAVTRSFSNQGRGARGWRTWRLQCTRSQLCWRFSRFSLRDRVLYRQNNRTVLYVMERLARDAECRLQVLLGSIVQGPVHVDRGDRCCPCRSMLTSRQSASKTSMSQELVDHYRDQNARSLQHPLCHHSLSVCSCFGDVGCGGPSRCRRGRTTGCSPFVGSYQEAIVTAWSSSTQAVHVT